MIDPIELQSAVVILLLGIVGADDFDELPIARTATVCHHHFVIGTVRGPFPA